MKLAMVKALTKGITPKFLAKEAIEGALISAAIVVAANAWKIKKGELSVEEIAVEAGILPDEMEDKPKRRLFAKKSA